MNKKSVHTINPWYIYWWDDYLKSCIYGIPLFHHNFYKCWNFRNINFLSFYKTFYPANIIYLSRSKFWFVSRGDEIHISRNEKKALQWLHKMRTFARKNKCLWFKNSTTKNSHYYTGAVDKPCAPFKVPISPTKKPETPSRLVSNESFSSLLSRDVPGYEILT